MFEGHSKIHTCKLCSKPFSFLSKLKEHKKPDKPVEECPMCYRKFKRVDHHQTHVEKCSEFLLTFVDISHNFNGVMLQENLATSEISEKDNIELHTDQVVDFELACSSKSEGLPSNSSIKSADSNANLKHQRRRLLLKINQMLQGVELQQKSKILSSVLKQNAGETVDHTRVESIFEGKVVNSL